MKISNIAAVFLALAATSVSAFSPSSGSRTHAVVRRSGSVAPSATKLFESVTAAEDAAKTSSSGQPVPMPASYREMVRQMSSAMKDADALGKNHQIIRVCLPRDADNANLGVYNEGLLDIESGNIALVPPGEFFLL